MAMARAVISLAVIVPVLSEKITVAAPRVSTDSSLRTSAPRLAILVALMDSDSDRVGSRPSGTSATMTPTANRNPSPSSSETPKSYSCRHREGGDDADGPVELQAKRRGAAHDRAGQLGDGS
jgi:hypothetical protein